MNASKTGADGTIGLVHGGQTKATMRDNAQEAHWWSEHEERDVYEVRAQEME